MPINLEDFQEKIQHKKGEKETDIEKSQHSAIVLDGKDGLSVKLGFREGMLSQADYLHINDDTFLIIEASDLRGQIQDCESRISARYDEILAQFFVDKPDFKGRPPKKLKGLAKSDCYEPIKIELMQKWCGSIATSERLCRNQNIAHHPKYKYVIVCRNGTDPQAMNYVKTKMSGAVGKLSIVTTDQIEL